MAFSFFLAYLHQSAHKYYGGPQFFESCMAATLAAPSSASSKAVRRSTQHNQYTCS